MTILYKKDSKGDILQWTVNSTINGIIIQAGKLNGKLVQTLIDVWEGKNIGKTNETSVIQQIELEIQSLVNRKKRQGYKSLEDLSIADRDSSSPSLKILLNKYLPKDSTDLDGNLKPMKCQQYYRSKPNWTDPTGKIWKDRKYYYLLNPYVEKEKNAIIIKFPCLIQPKINGVRATVSLDDNGQIQILSKEGLKYNVPHIEEEFKSLPFVYNNGDKEIDLIYDGELYIHGEPLQNIVSAVKSNNMFSSNIRFMCFDLLLLNKSNIERHEILKNIFNGFNINKIYGHIHRVSTYKVSSDDKVQAYTSNFIEKGYEGSILRDPNALYQAGKRPMSMVKLKRIISKEFKITGIVPQDKDPLLGMYQCITPEGEYFDVTATLSNEGKEELMENPYNYIGKLLTIDFYEYTEKKIPFHIINNIVRDYE